MAISPIRRNKENFQIVGVSACFAIPPTIPEILQNRHLHQQFGNFLYNDTTNHSGDIAKQALPPTIWKFSLFRLIGEIATNNIKQFFNDTTNHSGDIAKQALPPTILKFSMLSLIGEIGTNNIKQFSQRYHQPFRRYCKTGTLHQQFENFLCLYYWWRSHLSDETKKIFKLLVYVPVLQYLRNGWSYRCENCFILLVAISPRNKENLKIVGGSACFAIPPTIPEILQNRHLHQQFGNFLYNDTTNHSGDIAKQALPPTILKYNDTTNHSGDIAKQALTPTIWKFSQRYDQPFRRYCETGTSTNNFKIFYA
ncbi:unnamed protein product [Schistosoma mattheei]|uniref:Uncharacterized protein n=1 Tax=Schistosoma mattheei TaxID=31246 RepID=A0A183Q2M1_9TREM|nr:unnamed protein product [Schistosoma mattheei]